MLFLGIIKECILKKRSALFLYQNIGKDEEIRLFLLFKNRRKNEKTKKVRMRLVLAAQT